MLKRLEILNFTVFGEADITFSKGLNVIIGANSTGKSHLLKLGYSAMKHSRNVDLAKSASKDQSGKDLGRQLMDCFQSETIGRLGRRIQGRSKTQIKTTFEVKDAEFDFEFSTASQSEVKLSALPLKSIPHNPVFLPAKEVLSFFYWLPELYKEYQLPIESTYADLCNQLGVTLKRGPGIASVSELVETLEKIMGGKIVLENKRFYLQPRTGGGGNFEIDLVSEGFRKLGLLSYLLRNGTLSKDTALFWDEPEANLNNEIQKLLAEVLIQMAANGFQINIATHSLFLLKEIHILSKEKGKKVNYINLSRDKNSTKVTVTQSDSLDMVEEIPALDADLEQSSRFAI